MYEGIIQGLHEEILQYARQSMNDGKLSTTVDGSTYHRENEAETLAFEFQSQKLAAEATR